MQKAYDRSFVARYTVLGVFVGIILVCTAILIQAFADESALSWGFVLQLHGKYPVMYLLDLTPLWLGGLLFVGSSIIAQVRFAREQVIQGNETHIETLNALVGSIERGEMMPFQPDAHDNLGQALIKLRNDIAVSREEESKRRQEDQLRNWTSDGLAQLGEILRKDTDRLEDLAYRIVSHLAKYVGANQCGFYLVEGEEVDDRHFSLLACYAYDRRKFAQRRLEWGDGLIGACALEGVTTRLNQLPEGYLSITSGLGQATARNLILVPVKQDDTVFAVMELASFTPFTEQVTTFCERVADTVASALASKQISIRTAKLLAESRKQAQALVEQEEQMRQNMEELQTTQEEAARQSETFVSFTNSVNQTLIRAEYRTDGTLVYANAKFLQKLEYNSIDEVQGKPIWLFIDSKDRIWFDPIWEGLTAGGRHFEGDMKHVTRNGKELWSIATYTCVRNQNDVVEKILFLAIDTTRDKKRYLDWQGQVDALNRVSLKAELTPLGDVIDINDKFEETLHFPRTQMLQKPFSTIITKNDRLSFERLLESVCQGENFEGTLRAQNASGQDCWLRASLTTVNDMYGDIAKVIFIANDITREKLMELEMRRQTEQLKEQEEQLRQNEVELNHKLRQAREEVKSQFREIEKVQIRNEKTLEGFLDAIITTDQEGVVEFFNRAAEELFAIDRSEVLGQNIRLLFPPESEDNDFLRAYLDPNAEKIIGERREVNIRTSSGEDISVLMLLSEAKVGRKISYTAFVQNISLDLF